MLYLEEAEVRVGLHQYDIVSAQLFPCSDQASVQYQLEVPHLQENRPSVVVGDSVHISLPNNSSK